MIDSVKYELMTDMRIYQASTRILNWACYYGTE